MYNLFLKYKDLTEEYYNLLRESDCKNYYRMQQISRELASYEREYPCFKKMIDEGKITRKVLKNFLKDDYDDYKDNEEALKLWAEILKKKDVVIYLKILSEQEYEELFEKQNPRN